MRKAEHLTEGQKATFARLNAAFEGSEYVVLGATALGCWLDSEWRGTADIDITVTVDNERSAALLRVADGWTRHPRMEHRWTSPDGVLVDILPATDEVLATGKIVWPSGVTMNVAGFRLALAENESFKPGDDGPTFNAATVPVITLLKMAAYLDRPAERARDLQDIAHIFDRYLDEGDDRNFASALWDAGLEGDQASAFALGQDLGELVNDTERAVVEKFLSKLLEGEEPSPALGEMASSGPRGWHRDPKQARRRVEAFRKGFQRA